MKKIIILIGIFLTLHFSVTAQKPLVETKATSPVKTVTADDLNKLPFERGKWQFFITRENLGASKQSVKVNGIDQGDQSRFSLNLGTNYFIAKGIGIGIELDADYNKSKNMNTLSSSSWMAYANFTYGAGISDDINFYVRAGAGLGGQVDKYSYLNISNKDKTNLFGFKGQVGFPIRIENKGAVFLTPMVSYEYTKSNFDQGSETDNNFGVGLRLESYLFCRQLSCNAHKGYRLSEHMYDQGRSFLGLTTVGGLGFGNLKTMYDNNNYPTEKEKYSQANLSAEYMYYVVKNFSLGLDLSFSSTVNKNTAADYKYTYTGANITPMFELYLPVKDLTLNNISINAGYGFGWQRSENKSGNNTNTSKSSSTNFCAGIGYNFFFYKKLSLSPRFEYEWLTYKDKDSDQKQKYDGPAFSVGVRKFF